MDFFESILLGNNTFETAVFSYTVFITSDQGTRLHFLSEFNSFN